MAGLSRGVKRLFPLESISSVLALFKLQLGSNKEPNLALLSIVVGAIENQLTVNRSVIHHAESDRQLEPIFPVIDLPSIEALYSKFFTLIKGSVDLSEYKRDRYATRELVKKVSDVIWSSLTRSFYKDRAHLQSLFSYLTGNKLDCFGVAFAVVAACQILGFKDVHLALSEDHAWVMFGKDGTEDAEVTWHGKGNEDKRGQSIGAGVQDKSWLYLNGHPVICTRHMEVVAMISGINPSISATTDSTELSSLQKELLWMLYDMNHLTKYPMALGNLGDLEVILPTDGRHSSELLFKEAILSAKTYYQNKHVYPYTYLGGYLYGCKRYKEALYVWANAANVIRNYNYTREDEEIYKEFLEIANEFIPYIMKVSAETIDHPKVHNDPECFSYLLQFYDGLCEWEENSSTPVLHIGWTKPLVLTISKFDSQIRNVVNISVPETKDDSNDNRHDKCDNETKRVNNVDSNANNETVGNSQTNNCKSLKNFDKFSSHDSKNGQCDNKAESSKSLTSNGNTGKCTNKKELSNCDPNNNKNRITPDIIDDFATQIESTAESLHPNIAALAARCGDNILNPDYLLSGQDPPFSSRYSSCSESSSLVESKVDCREFLSTHNNGSPFPGMTLDSILKADTPSELAQATKNEKKGKSVSENSNVHVMLRSCKMMGLKDLLLAEKLNGSAIQLQLTAQSQVQVSKRGRHSSEADVSGRRTTKRSRRN